MNEFIEKLIKEISNKKDYFQRLYECEGKTEHDADLNKATQLAFDDCLSVIEQLAEEYNNGWISIEDALPELTEGTECFKQSPCCLITLKWWDGDMTESIGWYNQSGVWSDDSENCKVVAWMPLPPKYQPKGE